VTSIRSGTCFTLPIVLALALAVFPLLPPEHLHRAGIEGRTTSIVHAHTLQILGNTPSGTSFTQPHGNHGLAVFLTTVFHSGPQGPSGPVLLVAASVVIAPTFRFVGLVDGALIPYPHGPPGTAWLTRGPPALS
jgi:hypothetical protein